MYIYIYKYIYIYICIFTHIYIHIYIYKVLKENGKSNYHFIPTSLFRGCPLIRWIYIYIYIYIKSLLLNHGTLLDPVKLPSPHDTMLCLIKLLSQKVLDTRKQMTLIDKGTTIACTYLQILQHVDKVENTTQKLTRSCTQYRHILYTFQIGGFII